MLSLNDELPDNLFTRAKKVDDLAFKILIKSLPKELNTTISRRILYDYMSDIGAIGILRKLYLEDFNLEKISKLYWQSRKEVGNPNFESILSQLLLNLSASLIYDQIKLLYDTGLVTPKWLSLRDIPTTAGLFSPSEFSQILQHARILYSLYKLKGSKVGTKSAQKIVEDLILDKTTLSVKSVDTADLRTFEVILDNMRVIARGVTIDSVRNTGHDVEIPVGGLVIQGAAASQGIAWGKPITATTYMSLNKPVGDFVIVMDSHELNNDETAAALWEGTAAITGDSTTGHVSVLARGLARPCAASVKWRDKNLANFSFAVVDGFLGTVRLFLERPVGFPDLSGRRSSYKRDGD